MVEKLMLDKVGGEHRHDKPLGVKVARLQVAAFWERWLLAPYMKRQRGRRASAEVYEAAADNYLRIYEKTGTLRFLKSAEAVLHKALDRYKSAERQYGRSCELTFAQGRCHARFPNEAAHAKAAELLQEAMTAGSETEKSEVRRWAANFFASKARKNYVNGLNAYTNGWENWRMLIQLARADYARAAKFEPDSDAGSKLYADLLRCHRLLENNDTANAVLTSVQSPP